MRNQNDELYAVIGLAFVAAITLATLIVAFAITYKGIRP